MLRLVHVSDFHLGVGFRQLVGDDVPGFVNNHILGNVKRSVDYALDNDVDIYLVTGDIFNKMLYSLNYSPYLLELFKPLVDRGIYVILIAGNHDAPKTRGKHNALYVINKLGVDRIVYIESPDESVLTVDVDGYRVGFVALPFVNILRDADRKISRFIRESYDKIRDSDVKILATHLDVSGARYSESDTLVRSFYMLPYRVNPSSLHPNLFDYVALGHIHLHQQVGGYPNMWYAGSIDRVNFGEVGQPKGFLKVDIDAGEPDIEFLETEPLNLIKVEDLEFRHKFDVKDLVSSLEGVAGLRGSLVKIEARFDRESWDDYRSLFPRVKLAVLEELGVRGFVVVPSYINPVSDVEIGPMISLDRNWIMERLRDYINSIRDIKPEDRRLMIEYSTRLIMEEYGD